MKAKKIELSQVFVMSWEYPFIEYEPTQYSMHKKLDKLWIDLINNYFPIEIN